MEYRPFEREIKKYMADIDAWLIKEDEKIGKAHEKQRIGALGRIDKLEARAIKHNALNAWREIKIKDMRRYVNQYKFLPKSYSRMFSDWIYEARTGIRTIYDEYPSWVPKISKQEYMELIKTRGAHITNRP